MVSSAVFQSLIVLSVFSVKVSATNPGFYRVEFLEYRNPGGLDENNDTCDGSERYMPCEFYFKITFQVGNKLRKKFTSYKYKDNIRYANNCISFGPNLSDSEPNPFVLNVSTFQGQLQYDIEVWDKDGVGNPNDHIETLKGKLNVPLNTEWTHVNATRGKAAPSFLTFRIKWEYYSTEASSSSVSPTTRSKEDHTTGTSASPTKRSKEDNPARDCNNGKERSLIIALAVVSFVFVVCFIPGFMIFMRTHRKLAIPPPAQTSQRGQLESVSNDLLYMCPSDMGHQDSALNGTDDQSSNSGRSNQEAGSRSVDDGADHIYSEVSKTKKKSQNVEYVELENLGLERMNCGQPDVIAKLEHV